MVPPTAGQSPTVSVGEVLFPGEVAYEEGSDNCERFWVRSEFLLWWTRGQKFPPLVTTSPLGTPLPIAGLLGQPTTTVLFGGDREGTDTRGGARFTAGFWLNDHRTLGLEARWFQLDTASNTFTANSNQFPILTLPFFDETGQQLRRFTGLPGFTSGSITLDNTSRFYSGDVTVRANLYDCCCVRVDALLGYRQMRLNEDFNFRDSEIGAGRLAGFSTGINDHFSTRNRFQGADLGLTAQVRRCRWTLDASARVALGVNDREVNANGITALTVPGAAPVMQPGGFFALPTNSGRRSSDEFTAIPELTLGVGHQITKQLRATIGYNFIYWPNVYRVGEQIDTTVNLSQLPTVAGPGSLVGAARPAALQKESDFWVHGLSFGLEFRY